MVFTIKGLEERIKSQQHSPYQADGMSFGLKYHDRCGRAEECGQRIYLDSGELGALNETEPDYMLLNIM